MRAFLRKVRSILLFLVCGIMAFRDVLTEKRAVARIQAELVQYGIPSLVALMAGPFSAGFITGAAVGFAGASFPLVIALLRADRPGLPGLLRPSPGSGLTRHPVDRLQASSLPCIGRGEDESSRTTSRSTEAPKRRGVRPKERRRSDDKND